MLILSKRNLGLACKGRCLTSANIRLAGTGDMSSTAAAPASAASRTSSVSMSEQPNVRRTYLGMNEYTFVIKQYHASLLRANVLYCCEIWTHKKSWQTLRARLRTDGQFLMLNCRSKTRLVQQCYKTRKCTRPALSEKSQYVRRGPTLTTTPPSYAQDGTRGDIVALWSMTIYRIANL